MGGITATGGLGHEDDGVLASPEAWKAHRDRSGRVGWGCGP